MLLGIYLLPFYLLLLWLCGTVLLQTLSAGWQSGAVPTALCCVVLAFVLMLVPGRRKARR